MRKAKESGVGRGQPARNPGLYSRAQGNGDADVRQPIQVLANKQTPQDKRTVELTTYVDVKYMT